MSELEDLFADLEDPRAGNARRHSLHDILVIALCAIICGGQTCTDMELFGRAKRELLQSFLKLENGIPSHDTFSRVLGMLDPEAFQGWFIEFMAEFAQGVEGVVAVDGKTLRRSYDRAGARSPLHLVSAWAEEQRLSLGQVAVAGKSNEIKALPKLLELLNLRGKVVTADAMHCQRQVAQQVVAQKGDYALALKGNQGRLRDDVQLFLEDPDTPATQASEVSKGHGRVERRQARVSGDIDWLQERYAWPGLKAVGKVTATRQLAAAEPAPGELHEETRYYLLSRDWSPERFNAIVRDHWGIENRLHWVLDVTCNEDQARNRKGHGAENLALLRKLALNLARLEPGKGSMRGKLKRAGWDDNFLINILAQFTKFQMR